MGKTEKPKPNGRPAKEFDLNRVKDFGRFRATFETMASLFDCSVDTIRKRMQDADSGFYKAYKKGEAERNLTLAEAQIFKATGGTVLTEKVLGSGDVIQYNTYFAPDSTMLIWLGKQYLGQVDTPTASEDSDFELIDDWTK